MIVGQVSNLRFMSSPRRGNVSLMLEATMFRLIDSTMSLYEIPSGTLLVHSLDQITKREKEEGEEDKHIKDIKVLFVEEEGARIG